MVASPGLMETGDADKNIDYLKFDIIYRTSSRLWMGSFLNANIFLVVKIYFFGIFSGKAYYGILRGFKLFDLEKFSSVELRTVPRQSF